MIPTPVERKPPFTDFLDIVLVALFVVITAGVWLAAYDWDPMHWWTVPCLIIMDGIGLMLMLYRFHARRLDEMAMQRADRFTIALLLISGFLTIVIPLALFGSILKVFFGF